MIGSDFEPSGYEIPDHVLSWLTPAEVADLDQILAVARDAAKAMLGCGKTVLVTSYALWALDKLTEYEELARDRKERGFV